MIDGNNETNRTLVTRSVENAFNYIPQKGFLLKNTFESFKILQNKLQEFQVFAAIKLFTSSKSWSALI